MKIPVGLVGATGYTGQELLRILAGHPNLSVRYLASLRLKKAQGVAEVLPAGGGFPGRIEPFNFSKAISRCEGLFLALPHGVAMNLVPRLFAKKRDFKIADLSGDFRLRNTHLFKATYGLRHASPSLLREAVYGLTEWSRKKLSSGRLVANPGCYPTATLLALLPLAREGLLKGDGLVVDAKSGVTGAGRSLKEELLFSEVNEDLRAYRVNAHHHMPEMEQALKEIGRRKIRMTFVPHLVPINRGLYATIYAPLVRRMKESTLRALFHRFYGKEPFIRILPSGSWPQTRAVAYTNRCDIGIRMGSNGRGAILLSAIDNLGKGAAGQAVQNMNLLFGLPEASGLI